MDIVTRAKRIALVVFDVDGVLTDGSIIIGQEGELSKTFHAQDGMGISLAHRAGLRTAIITGRESQIVARRAAELAMGDVHQGAGSKTAALKALLAKYQLEPEQVAYVGDDLNDLPVLLQVGLACAVANAVPEVKERVHYISQKAGGQGAVREIMELILQAQDKWTALVDGYLNNENLSTAQ